MVGGNGKDGFISGMSGLRRINRPGEAAVAVMHCKPEVQWTARAFYNGV